MNTRTDNSVTLTHAQADAVRALLSDYASAQADHCRRTSSEAVRVSCANTYQQARHLAKVITEALYTWSTCPTCEGDSADDTSVGECDTCHGRGRVVA